jgi:hypothetical protein
MTKTFQLIRDPLDSDQLRFVTNDRVVTVWGSIFCDFFHNGATPHLEELIANNETTIECVITTKAHYDVLMAEADAQEAK